MTGQTERTGAALAFDGLTVKYGRRTAVEGVSLSVGAGEVYALLGRNGSGKTSMVRCLLGHRKPTAGRASLMGRDAWRERAHAVARVGVVPEEPDAPQAMTARQLVAFCRRLYPKWDEGGVAERLTRFGVPMDVAFGRLSKGQKGELALALALGPLPEVLILDDPTLGLDVVARREFFQELVGDLADRGTTVFITTHDLQGIEGIATRAGVLREGRLVIDEEMDALKARFRALRWPGPPDAVEGGLEAMDAARVSTSALGTEAVVQRVSEEAFARLKGAPGGASAEVHALSLEEIFIALTGEEGGTA